MRAVWWNRQEGTAYSGVGIKVVFLPRAHRMGVQAVSGARAFLGDKGCLRAPAAYGVIGWVRGHRLCAEAQGFSRNMRLLGVQAGLGTQKCLGSHAVLGA